MKACSSSPELHIPITCKIRLQQTVESTIQIARMLEDAGCAMLAIHGRKLSTNKNHRDGPANLAAIAATRKALRIPVITNGNVRCAEDVTSNLRETGCEGIMCAEQLLKDPALFERAQGPAPETEEMVDEYMLACDEFLGDDDTNRMSVWGASNGHVIREHVLAMRRYDPAEAARYANNKRSAGALDKNRKKGKCIHTSEVA